METPTLDNVGEVCVKFENGYAYCFRNAGKCYGGVRKTVVDCRGLNNKETIEQIREYAGDVYAKWMEE